MTLFRNRSRAFLLSLVLGAVGAAGCEPETPVLDIPKDQPTLNLDTYCNALPLESTGATPELVRRLPDGSVGPGAWIRLREYLGANRRYEVNIRTAIEKLDEQGFIHNPVVHGISGIARMEYTFTPVAGGTLYENCLIVGGASGWRRWLNPLIERFVFTHEQGVAWLRHNIEEVGLFERFLPDLYRRETGN